MRRPPFIHKKCPVVSVEDSVPFSLTSYTPLAYLIPLLNYRQLTNGIPTVQIQLINGRPAIVLRASGQAIFVIAIDVDGDQVQAVRVQANPDKLRRI